MDIELTALRHRFTMLPVAANAEIPKPLRISVVELQDGSRGLVSRTRCFAVRLLRQAVLHYHQHILNIYRQTDVQIPTARIKSRMN